MKMIKHMVMLAALAMAAPLAAEETAADSSAAPAAPASAQEIASGVCAGCHNADGNSVIPMNPILAGQQAEYITK
ncbi:MAG: cytochrome c4, partial [Nitrosomonadaceae bacterium]|nr:cytochrome c4 [Nitrosomonadaceae bacterium]